MTVRHALVCPSVGRRSVFCPSASRRSGFCLSSGLALPERFNKNEREEENDDADGSSFAQKIKRIIKCFGCEKENTYLSSCTNAMYMKNLEDETRGCKRR